MGPVWLLLWLTWSMAGLRSCSSATGGACEYQRLDPAHTMCIYNAKSCGGKSLIRKYTYAISLLISFSWNRPTTVSRSDCLRPDRSVDVDRDDDDDDDDGDGDDVGNGEQVRVESPVRTGS